MAEALGDQPKSQIKHDWYQTETNVVITVLIKGVKEQDLKIEFFERKVIVNIRLETVEENLTYNVLHKIVPEKSSFKLTPSKIEIKLMKAEGFRWDKLEGEAQEEIKVIPQETVILEGPPSYPTSKKGKDWNKIEHEIKEQEAKEKPEGEEALNKLFQEIYGKGSDEVKKAMNKSFMESGGTVLSTNWNEISKQKVEVKPPDGMEFKKWND